MVPADKISSGSDLGLKQTSRNKKFGKRLQEKRLFKGLTQQELASLLHVNKTSIQRWELGDIPTGIALLAMSELFGCTVDWLLKGRSRYTILPANISLNNNNKKDTDSLAQESNAHLGVDTDQFKISDLITKSVEILESKTIYRTALAININAFHQAIRAESKLDEMEARMSQMEEMMRQIMAENVYLKKGMAQMQEQLASEESLESLPIRPAASR